MYALRSLLKAPGFTVLAVLTLAVGLGANTAIFSAVYAILLQPLPFQESDQLVAVRTMVKRDTWERRGFSNPDFRDYRAEATRSFAVLAAYDGANFNLIADNEATRIRGERVSADYFAVLGVKPSIGRTFSPEEDSAPDLAPLVVLRHEFWRDRLGASPDVLGRTIKLSDLDHTIVGVMPLGFRGLDDSTQLWVPMTTIGADAWNARGSRGREVVARLRPGVTLEQARAELAAIGRNLAAQHPQTNTNYSADVVPLREEFFGRLRGPLLVLLGAVGFVLLITCVNVANLLLVRLATRRREIAIRISLGAGRGPLAWMFLAESLLLACAGGTLGVLLATWLLAALQRFAPVNLPAFVSLELHGPAFLFAAAVTLLCALIIGALPAMLAGRADLNSALKDVGRSGHSGASGSRVRNILVTAELALSLALLVASSLFVRSFVNLVTQAPGYRTDKVVTHRVLLPSSHYDRGALRQFTRTLLERTAALPGVRTAALATDTPLEGISTATSFVAEGSSSVAAENEGRVYTHAVTPDFFQATGIALLEGEAFAASYAPESEPVAIVSESFARRFWPKNEAVGKRYKLNRNNPNAPWIRIIGVAAETKYRGLVANPTRDPDTYAPFDQRPTYAFTVVVHTAGESRTIGQSLRQLIASMDPNIPVFSIATIEERIANASSSQRFSAQLMGTFAVAALALAAIGVYGVVSFGVAQRTQEIGVRMALGARPADILRLILGQTGRVVMGGLFAGGVIALALTRFIESLLFNVNARDPIIYAGVAAILLLVALLAAWLPARRAAKVDPMTALRTE